MQKKKKQKKKQDGKKISDSRSSISKKYEQTPRLSLNHGQFPTMEIA